MWRICSVTKEIFKEQIHFVVLQKDIVAHITVIIQLPHRNVLLKKPSDVGLYLNRRFQYLKILLKQKKKIRLKLKIEKYAFVIKHCRAFILPR